MANPDSLRARLERVSRGEINSALDYFLMNRIPIQFGGMTDPFSEWELEHRISLYLLEILKKFDYPTIISTKGSIFGMTEYVDVLQRGNFYIRVSFTGAEPQLAQRLEAGVGDLACRLSAIEALASVGVPISARLQPLIPGHEESAERLMLQAARVGVRHVSVEYLKLPMERVTTQAKILDRELPNIREYFKLHSATRNGREFILPAEEKISGHDYLCEVARSHDIHYGHADNEFLLRNEFLSCCNGADLFLREASFFDTNLLGILRRSKWLKDMRFIVEENRLSEYSLDNYLNSRSRSNLGPAASGSDRWLDFLKKKWNAPSWRGGPTSFWKVMDTGKLDDNGNKIYSYEDGPSS
jgi:DNA repair photolyase